MEKLGTPTGIKVSQEKAFHMNQMPSGDWLIEITSNIDATASMTISKDHMRHIRNMLDESIED